MREMLFVDDDSDVLDLLRMVCKFKGIKAVFANNPRRALEMLGDGGYCAVITDFQMIDMSGSELAQAAKELRPGLPVFCLTGSSAKCIGQRELFNGIFEKPTDIAAMLESINHHLDQLRA